MNRNQMWKIVIALVLVAGVVTACGQIERTVAQLTGWARLCVAGVSYLQFTSGVTVEYTPESKVKTCK